MAFSERMGFKPTRALLQLDGIDAPLRVAIYNLIYEEVIEGWYNNSGRLGTGYYFARQLWTEYWRRGINVFPDSPRLFAPVLSDYVTGGAWFEIYDFIEFSLADPYLELDPDEVNELLERDMSGYRIRAGVVVPITDDVELAAVDEALAIGDQFNGARQHVKEALTKLAQRPNPDSRIAITEAVSAVESAARIVTGNHKATLGDALKVLEKRGHVHPALKDAWLKLYGYTSDEHGLRHAMTEEVDIDFATAKYMVVSCAAFVNLLSAQL